MTVDKCYKCPSECATCGTDEICTSCDNSGYALPYCNSSDCPTFEEYVDETMYC